METTKSFGEYPKYCLHDARVQKIEYIDDSLIFIFDYIFSYENGVEQTHKAQVVFDNYAFAYKYTPAPKFSIEFVDDWSGIGEDPDIYKKPSFLLGRTKHKIWREGNVLKYKSWK